MSMQVDIYTDGGARGNPGPAGIGAVIKHNGKVIAAAKKFIGEATNDQAEYRAVLLAMETAHTLGATALVVHLDSELVASQLARKFKVKDAELAKLCIQVWNLSHHFSSIQYHWIPREKNYEADALVNEAIDEAL